MISFVLFIVLGVLIIASYLDLKYKAIPSILLTGTIFILLILRPENLIFGIILLAFGLLMEDFLIMNKTEFGLADIKVLVILGLLLSTMSNLFITLLVFIAFQFVYTIVWKIKMGEEEMAFVPCLTAIYIALMILGVVA